MYHSELLWENKIWKIYTEKTGNDMERVCWVKKVYENAKNQLGYIPRTFPNYTLHNEKHILNILDTIAGLLGNQIVKLTVGEAELLILAACLHDVGMVYTDDEKKSWLNNKRKCKEFLNKYDPSLIGIDSENWDELVQQNYLRWLHPFRVAEVLRQEMWEKVFYQRPKTAMIKDTIIAVCQSHGETPEILKNKAINIDGSLRYMSAKDDGYDPLFCAILLRLGDLMDFDDTRAPDILYTYTGNSKKSQEEWKKHMASSGFNYPTTPSEKELPFYAECTDPTIERTINNFLDWIDEELFNSRDLQRLCCERWKNFAFPYKIMRREISREGYDYGNFKLTMDQEQILKLLAGEKLYDSNDVFIRELLQNAIDATLLRGKMDSNFDVEAETARIDFWEWSDDSGNIWFRIDDRGTGMTKGMMERYFLKVGNSYYNSDELVRDLRVHGQQQDYTSISRFGIGFLSCFLCAISVQISTVYFDENKCRCEEGDADAYGIRMNITGLNDYYVVQNQAIENNIPKSPMPAPQQCEVLTNLEYDNYRIIPGTSIVMCIDPGKLGTINLKKSVEKIICGTDMPIYYNNKRIGRTYKEIMAEANNFLGEHIYELNPAEKMKFDKTFPEVAGKYPNIIVTTILLDDDEYQMLDGFSGVLLKYEVRFNNEPVWSKKNWKYDISVDINYGSNGQIVIRFCKREQAPFFKSELPEWPEWAYTFTYFDIALNTDNIKRGPEIKGRNRDNHDSICFYYNGIFCGQIDSCESFNSKRVIPIIFLKKQWRPDTNLGRTKIISLKLDVLLAVFSSIAYVDFVPDYEGFNYTDEWRLLPLSEWRKVDSQLKDWIWKTYTGTKLPELFLYEEGHHRDEIDDISPGVILNTFFAACYQDMYTLAFSYDEETIEQEIEVLPKREEKYANNYKFFPPLMLCHPLNETSQKYLCSDNMYTRSCINVEHPFMIWLLENAEILNNSFSRQFRQIIEMLRFGDEFEDDEIINVVNNIREQLLFQLNQHKIDMSKCPELSESDFYYTEI